MTSSDKLPDVNTITMVGIPPEPLLDMCVFSIDHIDEFVSFLRERLCLNCGQKHLVELDNMEGKAQVLHGLEMIKESCIHSMETEQDSGPQAS